MKWEDLVGRFFFFFNPELVALHTYSKPTIHLENE